MQTIDFQGSNYLNVYPTGHFDLLMGKTGL